MDYIQSPSVAHGVSPTAPYERAPSPPFIQISSYASDSPGKAISVVPHFGDVDSGDLTERDLAIITQGKPQISNSSNTGWKYEHRREAQPILDFIYLGPSSAARDVDFLRREGITMILACRDSQFGGPMTGVQRAAGALGIAVDAVDIRPGNPNLVAAFPIAVRKINDHLLSVYRQQAVQPVDDGMQQPVPVDRIAIDRNDFRRGKVLVCCETGNDRSAAIVAAYIMAVLGADAVKSMQFVLLQRFSASFGDEMKIHLRSYEDLLTAKRDVVKQQRLNQVQHQLQDITVQPSRSTILSKRRIDESSGLDEADTDIDGAGYDGNVGRGIAPFVERNI